MLQSSSDDQSTMRVSEYLTMLTGLLGLVAFIHYYDIEAMLGLEALMWVIVPGFALYNWVPLRYKMPFYFLLSVVALLMLYGTSVGLAVLVVILGFCWMTTWSIDWWVKVALTGVMFAGLVVLRTRFFSNLGGHGVARVAGILLMFRSVAFLYEIKHEKEKPNIWLRLNYLLLAPNLIFFLFPIIDYKTFMRGLFAKPAAFLAFRGLRWMLLALVQFMFYRILYSYFLPAASDVVDIYSMIQYLFISYALILRLSAIFHFSAGVVCLFGFDLPPTFNNYFLATSFSDLWRRINIYWRDFVMKVFYFPIYFKFKKRNSQAVFLTILIVFFFNWFMHAYQWLWIKGSFLWQSTDVIFWALLGLFMATSAVYQTKNKRKFSGKQAITFKQALINSSKILGVLATMSLLWGFWISPDVSTWWNFITSIEAPTALDIGTIFASALGLVLIGAVLHLIIDNPQWQKREKQVSTSKPFFFACLVLPLLLTIPSLQTAFTANVPFSTEAFFTQQLNKQDQELVFQGYYDQLIVGNNFSAARVLEFNKDKNDDDWGNLSSTGLVASDKNALLKELQPNSQVTFKQSPLSTNSQGLRDQEYPLVKPANSTRIALLGGSMEMGSGIQDEQTFEHLLEQLLNQSPTDSTPQIEIINFAISGIHLPQHVAIVDHKINAFDPDVVIYTAHFNEVKRAARAYGKVMLTPEELIEYPFLYDIANKLKLNKNMSAEQYATRIDPYMDQLYNWGLEQIVTSCRRNGIVPIYLYLPIPGDRDNVKERQELASLAKDKGFHFIDMYGIFTDIDPNELTIATYDQHPNAKGNQLIADSLYVRLSQDSFIQKQLLRKEK